MASGRHIFVGMGGWTFPPWRGTFYPPGLAQARELEHAATRVTAIEINATFHGTQKRESFRKWAAAVPDGFRFAVKASRHATSRRLLAEGRESIEHFLHQGLDELGDRLGPILWQLPATKRFDSADIEAFLDLLPEKLGDRPLAHAIEALHESFGDDAYRALVKERGIAIVHVETGDGRGAEGQPGGGIGYGRFKASSEAHPNGYPPKELERIDALVDGWRTQGARDRYAFFIAGDKVRAPLAAEALIGRL